ncbi:MAG: ABC transporter permease subunit [Gemmatimonadaceae bacterium]|nr:ABC transporter permease subunit [Chitinophagaceae bacterium]
MLNLLKTEWLKIKKYPAFWVVMSITALSYPGINTIFYNIYKEFIAKPNAAGQMANALLGNPFSLPEVWRTTAYASSMFVFIPAIVVIMLISNEYTFKTTRQNIIDGWSRKQFMFGKLLDVIIITIVVTLLYAATAFIIGIYNTTDPNANKWGLFYYVGLFALQTFAQLTFAFLIGLIVRKAFIGLGIFIFYFLIAENMLVAFLGQSSYVRGTAFEGQGKWLPLELSDRIIPPPYFVNNVDPKKYQGYLDSVGPHVIYTIILIVLLWLLNFWIFKKRDL